MYRVLRRMARLATMAMALALAGGAVGFFYQAGQHNMDAAVGFAFFALVIIFGAIPIWIILRLFAWCCKPEDYRARQPQRYGEY